jgi:hypothetical protein
MVFPNATELQLIAARVGAGLVAFKIAAAAAAF